MQLLAARTQRKRVEANFGQGGFWSWRKEELIKEGQEGSGLVSLLPVGKHGTAKRGRGAG